MSHQPAPFLEINSPDVEIGQGHDLYSPTDHGRMAHFLTHPIWPWVGDAIGMIAIAVSLYFSLIIGWAFS